jgi:hypothetical protein
MPALIEGLKCWRGAKNLLDQLRCARASGRFHFAHMVGAGSNDSHHVRELVDRISQRLVLRSQLPFS